MRVLRAALEPLGPLALGGRCRSLHRALWERFPMVPTHVSGHDLERPLPRRAAHDSPAMTLARAILHQQLPTLRHGQAPLFALLFDMNRLFEDYIAVLLRRTGAPGRTQSSRVFLRVPGRSPRQVRPDLVTPGLVLDTKWKVPGGGMPSNTDLEQMFVYDALFAVERSVLVYPRSSAHQRGWDGQYAVGGREVSTAYAPLFYEGRPDARRTGAWLAELVERHQARVRGAVAPTGIPTPADHSTPSSGLHPDQSHSSPPHATSATKAQSPWVWADIARGSTPSAWGARICTLAGGLVSQPSTVP